MNTPQCASAGAAELNSAAAFDRILVNSTFSRESALRAYGLNAEVCYLGVDLTNFEDRAFPRENCVVGLGASAVTHGVAFTPHLRVADDVVVDLLNRATALLYSPRLEPFGLAPIEAGACGLPVVGVAEGGVRETVVDGETGFLVPSNPQAAAAALARLLADPALARRMGAPGRARAERQ